MVQSLSNAGNLLGAGAVSMGLVTQMCTCGSVLCSAGAAGGFLWYALWPKDLIPAVLGLSTSAS